MSLRVWFRKFLARHRRHPLVRKVGNNLRYYYDGYDNQDYDLETNGEGFVIRTVARLNPGATMIDVGGHHGEWTGIAAPALPGGRVHAFEVIPETFARLQATCGGFPNVVLNNVGLGAAEGRIVFSVAEGRDDLTSGVAGVHGELHRFAHREVSCPVTTGDRYCAEHGVERVALLKIDVEGLEPAVLAGFARMLGERRIDAVQFEYGQVNLQSHFFLGDFHRLFTPLGYRIGKVYPNHVEFAEYSFTQDRLAGPNFLAVDGSNAALLRALGGN